jgi:hypothetical protein
MTATRGRSIGESRGCPARSSFSHSSVKVSVADKIPVAGVSCDTEYRASYRHPRSL